MKRRDFIAATLATVAGGGLRNMFPETEFYAGDAAGFSSNTRSRQEPCRKAGIGIPLYEYDPLKWLFIGWENDHPKSWTFMGGGLGLGQQSVIQYTVAVEDITYYPDELAPERQAKIKWHLREGYLPCPVSEWHAGPVKVEIQHFANRVLEDSLTAVYSRVHLTNVSPSHQRVRIDINAGPTVEVPISDDPTGSTPDSMFFEMSLGPGGAVNRDFVAVASGDMASCLGLNKVVNPGFELDSQPTRTPRGWTTEGDADASYTTGWNPAAYSHGEEDAEYLQLQVQRSGRFHLVHHRATDHRVFTYQTVTGLPEGTYEFRAWVRATAGQGTHRIVARQYGGADLSADISSDQYHLLIIPNIRVTSGRCEIGFLSEGAGTDYATVDDVAFYESAVFESKAAAALKSAGGFVDNYARMAMHYNQRISALAHPVALPVADFVYMYKSIQILLWQCMVRSGQDYEIRAGARNPVASVYSYDRTFPHDVSDYVSEFMREGDYELGKKILASGYYKALNATSWDSDYVDTIGKYIIPYAEYLQATGDLAFFTPAVRKELRTAARNIHNCRVFDDPLHYGLMRKSGDFENSDEYLLCDNWVALHGLEAYQYLCDSWRDEEESRWAAREKADLNVCLNKALDQTRSRRKTDYYPGAFDDAALNTYAASAYSWVPYSGALATFPWGASLMGFELGGTWKDKFDASLRYALEERDKRGIPAGSWGAWWGQITYGSTYNVTAGIQCLFSEEYRTEAIKNLEFLLSNQCAPFQWSEAFENKGKDQWAGMYIPPGPYGNYESWGTSFMKQALLQACISVKTDGTVIIGRGIPNHWLKPGDTIEWANVNVNANRKIGFRITSLESEIKLLIWGDERNGLVRFNLPAFKNNIATTDSDSGSVDNPNGVVILTPWMPSVTVKLEKPVSALVPRPLAPNG